MRDAHRAYAGVPLYDHGLPLVVDKRPEGNQSGEQRWHDLAREGHARLRWFGARHRHIACGPYAVARWFGGASECAALANGQRCRGSAICPWGRRVPNAAMHSGHQIGDARHLCIHGWQARDVLRSQRILHGR